MQSKKHSIPVKTRIFYIMLMMLGCPAIAHGQFGVTDEQFDSIQAVCDSLEIVLGETSVAAKKRAVKAEIDKLVYSVSDDAEAQNQTLTEVLRKVPMVTVDGEDNVLVNGQSSFKVYVNGKPNQMMTKNPKEIFKAYPASAIRKIEVITDPGAKYDAEGVAGVLNIVTLEETLTKGWTVTPRIGARRTGNDAGFFGTVQYGRFTLSANYGCGLSSRMRPVYSSKEVEYLHDDVRHCLTSSGSASPDLFYNFGGIEASYEFTDHDLLSMSAGIFGHTYDFSTVALTAMTRADGAPLYSYKNRTIQHTSNMGYNAGLDYQHSFSLPEQTLTFSYRYDGSPQNQRQQNEYFDIVESGHMEPLTDIYADPDYHSQDHTFQADFTTPFGEHHQLSVGGKYILRHNESDSRQLEKPSESADEAAWVLNDAASLHYKHMNGIAAGYAEYMLKIRKFSLRSGLRFEHSHIDVSYPDGKRAGFRRNFDSWLPSFNLGYHLSDLQMLKLNYSYRIGRPGISQLSPFVNVSPGFRSYGNPRLESEGGHNFGASYSFFGQKFSISLDATFGFSNNGLASYTFMDRDNCINTTHDNFQHRRMGHLSGYICWNITPHTSLTFNGSGMYADYRVEEMMDATEMHDAFRLAMHNSGWSGYGMVNLRQDLWWRLKLGIYGGGSSPSVDLQGKGDCWYFYNLTLSRPFLKDDRLNVSVNVGNFWPRYRSYDAVVEGEGFIQKSTQRMDQMNFGISISWRLGKLQTMVKKARRSIQNDDVVKEQGSAGQGAGGQEMPK